MFEVDVKNVMKGRGEGRGRREGEMEEDQLGFGVLIECNEGTEYRTLSAMNGLNVGH